LNRSLNGSENDPKDMGNFVKAADAIRERFGAAVIVIHHCGIAETAFGSKAIGIPVAYGDQPRLRSAIDTSAASALSGRFKVFWRD
jgi:RecA-family ATPase